MNFESPVSLINKLITNKKFRDAFVYEQVKTGIPYQMRAMRKERDWKQGDMGQAAGKPRNVINRLENPNYGKLTLTTLFEIASGCDVALLVKFVPFSRLLEEYEDVSLEALSAPSITHKNEVKRLQSWARCKTLAEAEGVVTEPLVRLPLKAAPRRTTFATLQESTQPSNVVSMAAFVQDRRQRPIAEEGDEPYGSLVSSASQSRRSATS